MPSSSTQPVPTCKTCHVPMTLCHCSNSCCSSCALPAFDNGNKEQKVCECIGRALPVPPPALASASSSSASAAKCSRCAEMEQRLQDIEKSFAKRLAHRERELSSEIADLKKKIAEARAQAQGEREQRAKETAAHAAKVEEAEARGAQKVAEVERQLALARVDAANEAARGKKQAEEELRQELVDMRERVKAAEAEANAANESRLAHVAEWEEQKGVEKRLRSELARVSEQHEGLRAQIATLSGELAEAREQAKEAGKAQASLDAERRASRAAASKREADTLAYEGAVAEARKLQQQLHEASQRASKAEAEREALSTERSKLQQSLEHAERLKALFASVTARTNDVQAAANDVITQVEARKRAEKQTKQQALLPQGDGDSEDGAAPSVATKSQSARGPLRNASNGNTTTTTSNTTTVVAYPLPRPPSTADGPPRKGLAPGRPGVRSAVGSARGAR